MSQCPFLVDEGIDTDTGPARQVDLDDAGRSSNVVVLIARVVRLIGRGSSLDGKIDAGDVTGTIRPGPLSAPSPNMPIGMKVSCREGSGSTGNGGKTDGRGPSFPAFAARIFGLQKINKA